MNNNLIDLIMILLSIFHDFIPKKSKLLKTLLN